MEFRILGEVDVVVDGRSVSLGARKQRLLLAVLLCHPDRAVPAAQLVEALWGSAPPTSAADNLRVYVHRLRQALGAHRIVSRGRQSYAAAVPPTELDAARFVEHTRLAHEALANDEHHLARQHAVTAIELWRGAPFADLDGEPALRDEAARLEQHLHAAIECRLDAELRLGHNAFVITETRTLADRHPYHERFRFQLMTALYRSGRQAEALETYATTRRLFIDELGTEPSAPLRELHELILRGDPEPTQQTTATNTSVLMPAQLPADAAIMIGRQTQITRLDEVNNRASRRLIVLFGPAGVGKTSLAVHWAHHATKRFPDGQLYLDLQGYGIGQPVSVTAALRFFVGALGVPGDQMPDEERELVAQYRSLLATRRTLVILDNVGNADVVRPLLPGSSSCMVVVTSRGPLRGLQALDDATALPVQPLDTDESVSLIRTLLDTAEDTPLDGVDEEQLHETAALCAQLPLALRIAAANLAGRTRTQAADLLDAMRADLLGQLTIDDEPPAVRVAFDTSYATLPQAAQDVFRLIGRAPGQDISLPAVAALSGRGTDQVAPELARLVRAGLADHLSGDRFRLHDLLRRYATELPAPHDDTAIHRLFSFYHHTTITAVATAVQGVTRLDHDPCHPDVWPLSFNSAASASAWLQAELANLVALCTAATDSESARIVWQLADALRDYFWIRRCGPEWLAIAGNALDASKAAGDLRAQAASHNNLGVANWCLSRYSVAAAHFQDAIEWAIHARDDRATAAALSNLGGVYRETGDLEASITCCERALVLYEDLANTVGAANTRITLSGVMLDTGRFADAVDHAEHALGHYLELDRKDGQGSALLLISEAHTRTGRIVTAIEMAQEAMALFQAVGARQGEACALLAEAGAHLAANQVDTAEPRARIALAIGMDTGSEQLAAEAASCLADITRRRGKLRAAVDAYASVANTARRIKLRTIELAALIGQARALCDLGDFAAARRHAAAAVQLAEDNGYRYHATNARDILATARQLYGGDTE